MKCSEPCFIKKYLAELCEFTNLTMRDDSPKPIPIIPAICHDWDHDHNPEISGSLHSAMDCHYHYHYHYWGHDHYHNPAMDPEVTQKNRSFFESPFPVDFPFAKWSNSKTLSLYDSRSPGGSPSQNTSGMMDHRLHNDNSSLISLGLQSYIYWALPRDTNSDHNSYHKKKHKKNQVVVPNMTFISPY